MRGSGCAARQGRRSRVSNYCGMQEMRTLAPLSPQDAPFSVVCSG